MIIDKKETIKYLIVNFIFIILIFLIGIGIYNLSVKQTYTSRFVKAGNKYIASEKYDLAYEQYKKALRIDKENTKAGYGLAECYLGMGYTEKAIKTLDNIQRKNIEDADILEKNLEILKRVEPEKAYETLMKYVDYKGSNKLPKKIKEIYEKAEEIPDMPKLYPPPQKYATDVFVELEDEDLNIGHIYYYTTDGTLPNKNSKIFKGKIEVSKDTEFKIIGYNPSGYESDVYEFEYFIADDGIYEELKGLAESALRKHDNTEEGTDEGNCLEGSKNDFYPVIEKSFELLENKVILYEDAFYQFEELKTAFDNFESSIIYPSDKGELDELIQSAKEFILQAKEGENIGEYRKGAIKEFEDAVKEAKTVYESITSKQNDVDDECYKLIEAKKKFESKKITEIDKIISDSGAVEGEVSVTLLWEDKKDLDLHVTSPEGDTVYYFNSYSSSGGFLDVDTKPDSSDAYTTEGVNKSYYIENAFWDEAPKGTYRVLVKNHSEMANITKIKLKVRVLINGESKIYEKTISGESSEICHFTYN